MHGGEAETHWSGLFTQYLPKGATRKFQGSATIDVPPAWAGVTEGKDANGNITTFAWSAPSSGLSLSYVQIVTDPIGRVTTYGYENTWCEPYGEVAAQCDWHKRVKTITDPWGRVVTFTYDVVGANASLVQAQNAAGAITAYNVGAQLTRVQNARAYAYTFTWGTTGNNTNRITTVSAPDGTVTTYTYTALPPDYKVTETRVTNARGFATVYRFSAAGDLTSVTDALGGVTSYAYDGRHNVTQVTNARGFRTTYQYNSRNRVTQVLQDAGGLALTTTLTWDSNDNLLSVTNPRGIVTAFQYNATHSLTSVTKAQGTPAQAVTQYTYTTWGGVASVIDPRGRPQPSRTTPGGG